MNHFIGGMALGVLFILFSGKCDDLFDDRNHTGMRALLAILFVNFVCLLFGLAAWGILS